MKRQEKERDVDYGKSGEKEERKWNRRKLYKGREMDLSNICTKKRQRVELLLRKIEDPLSEKEGKDRDRLL